MTVKPDVNSIDGSAEWENDAATREALTKAYAATYRGPQGDAPEPEPIAGDAAAEHTSPEALVSPALLAAHRRLGRRRAAGTTKIAAYPDDTEGFGPALQLVTDHALMLMETLTVLLHRLGVTYVAIMSPVFAVHRGEDGQLLDLRPAVDGTADGVAEAWMHIVLAPSVDRKALAEAERLLPTALADARRIASDTEAMYGALRKLADALDSDTSDRFPAGDRTDVAQLLRWLHDGHFVMVGYQRCSVHDSHACVDEDSRLGVLRDRGDVFPQLTESNELLVLAQATMPSYLRFGAYPYVVVIRENPGKDSGDAIEHRLVGMFTVAAMNANVLEIPVIRRRVKGALAKSGSDPGSLPNQILLDIMQTFPRSELFALDVDQLLEMATAVIDLGSLRRTLLFLRSDQLGNFVSALVYLPRDRYTTAVRLEMQDILVRELGGVSIDYAARVSESPWAVVHFTVRLPADAQPAEVDTSDDNRLRIQGLLTEAARTWADRLIGAVQDRLD